MRKAAVTVATLLAGALATLPAGAGPSSGGMASDNVEFIRHIPLSIDGVGGRLVGKYFYTNDQNKIMIFDVSEPENPALTGVLPMPQEWLFSREDLDTNGKIMPVPNTVAGRLYIVDVRDKSSPEIISELPGAQSHTSSCVLNCKWVYNSNGQIVDIRKPRNPKLMETKWGDGKPAQSGHDVTEIAPGLVLTSSNPILLLDARRNPKKPKLLATSVLDPETSTMHSVAWENRGRDRFFLAGSETNLRPRCGGNNGAFMTWDASKWKRTHTFTKIKSFQVENGTFADGRPTVNYAYGGCSAHWFQAHPNFRNGGLVAAAFFEHGTRFLKVSRKGKIKEVGWFMPWGGSTGAAYWITKRIVYAVDYDRGIDIIRFTGAK